ncbi:family 20 glycosylhydrolase [Mangrovibacterium marinum]|uniref:beta-N-acetylhexosaminidase n=1 Tax=Mangrovibacterium marinum TaxID=1639118 RepID=A0A2T5C2Y4_9BACT|nr:family 20 glycosylhydrolase [Mangrovibacterium marinum]PTN09075.1 hexosaminidase [Mangrovibacterium marinum]
MKYTYLIVVLVWLASACSKPATKELSIVPYPAQLEKVNGQFDLTANTRLVVNDQGKFSTEVAFLQGLMQQAVGTKLSEEDGESTIELALSDSFSAPESYAINLTSNKILLAAGDAAGMFYAIESLRQLLPASVEQTPVDGAISIPALNIYDKPRFGWRGMHLDVSRHFFSVDYLKRFIDRMALYKLNKFHLHLTDDQGWRIEIKQYPQLIAQGAWRTFNSQDSTCIEMAKENPDYALDPKHIEMRDGVPYYGGFYTQEQLRELVKYAQERHVEIVPEIDMPGHMMAAINLFPHLSTTGKSAWGNVFSTPLNPVSEETYTFVENVLNEVVDIFPSKYIHIGADEVEKHSWKESQECREFMLKNGIKDYEHLQGYFVDRVAKFLQAKGKKVVVWDDALEGGIDSSLHVMYWRNWVAGVPEKVVNNGSELILTPGNPLYFSRRDSRMFSVYNMKLHGSKFPTDKLDQLKGMQACLWSETIPTEMVADQLMFPRALALAERAWTDSQMLDWQSFKFRVKEQLQRLQYLGVKLDYNPTAELIPFMEVDTEQQRIGIRFESEMSEPTVYYTTDGSLPTTASNLYTGEFFVSGSASICAAVFKDGQLTEPVLRKQVDYHKAIAKPVSYQKPWNRAYPAGDAGALTDGLRGGDSYGDGKWQGFTNDVDVTVDLGQVEELHSFSATFMQIISPGVYMPGSVEVSVSADGENFEKVLDLKNDIPTDEQKLVFKNFEGSLQGQKARYVHVVARNTQKAFLFTDELVIN